MPDICNWVTQSRWVRLSCLGLFAIAESGVSLVRLLGNPEPVLAQETLNTRSLIAVNLVPENLIAEEKTRLRPRS